METVTGHQIALDEDLRRILEIKQTTIAAERLCGVAKAVHEVGTLIWAHHQSIPVESVRLVAEPITTFCGKQSAAILSAQHHKRADGDSVVVEHAQKL